MKRKIFIALLFAVFSFTSCNSQNATVKNLTPDDFEKGIAKGNVQLIDVRSPEEYSEKHIGNAKNINIDGSDFEREMNSLDKSKPTYVYCLAGSRSKKASDWAAKNGFTEVYNLEYGINSWTGANKPVITSTGQQPKSGMSFDDYLKHTKNANKLVLVDFSAVWCGPCKTLKPIVQRALKKYNDKVELFEVDVDKNPIVSRTMNIKGIPLLILYNNGKEVWRSMGLIEEDVILDKFKELTSGGQH